MFPPDAVADPPAATEVRRLLGVPRSRELRVRCANVEQEQHTVYNAHAKGALGKLQAGEEALSALLLQAAIRRRNYRYVYETCTSGAISEVPKKRLSCCWCCYASLPRVNYSDYFDEDDWLMPLPLLKKQSRDYLIQLVEGLQIQLRMVESRLVCNNKVGVCFLLKMIVAGYFQ